MMTGGVVLFAVVHTSAFILAIYAARAGHRSWQDRHGGVRVAGPGHAYPTFVFTLMNGEWIGLAVAMVAVLGFAWVLSRRSP